MKRSVVDSLVDPPAGDQAPVKRPRRQPESKRVEAFSFLELPTEVRGLVLKELLWCSEPIDFQSRLPMAKYSTRNPLSDPKLYPHVLRTCQQLHEEGSVILYNNTIKCRAWSKHPVQLSAPHMFPHILSASHCIGTLGELPRAICEKICRIHVEVTAGSSKEEDLRILQCQLRALTRVIKETPSWKHVTIELNVGKPGSKMDDEILNPFLYLRGCESATVKGISKARAEKISTLMTSKDPVIDLDRMYTAIASYALSITHGGYAEHGLIEPRLAKSIRLLCSHELVKARDNDNAEAFCKQRRRLMTFISAYIMHQQTCAFAYDPDEWDVESKLFMKRGKGPETTDDLGQLTIEMGEVFAELAAESG